MILRRWTAVAVCMAALVGPACAQAQGDDQKGNRQQQNTQSEHAKPGSAQPTVSGAAAQPQAADKRPVKAEIYEPDCRQPKSQPDADLCTQRRVADAAENALQYALAQTLIGALGVAFVVVTLGFTARANKAAAIAAQAAVDSVGAERAWMFPDGFPHAFSNQTTVHGVFYQNAFMIAVSWRNGGRSPSIRTSSSISHKVVNNGDTVPEFDATVDENEGIVGPNFSIKSGWTAIGGQELDDFLNQGAALYVYSRVSYSTTFFPHSKVYSEICAKLLRNGDSVNEQGQRQPNIEIQVIGPQNTAI